MRQRLAQFVSDALLPDPPSHLGVAVSGGGDSMAMLQLLHEFSQIHGITLHAVTVDHRLRSAAAEEAASVAHHCARMGIAHDTLVWSDWDGCGNLQQAAREARYTSISSWAQAHNIDTVAMGHTADDQAETVLMRLSRRSGVDGLTAMQQRVVRHGVHWIRPLLRTRRDDLRRYLEQERIDWFDDPSNDDTSYDRIKARKALEVLAPLGIDANGLADIADQMASARKALEWHSFIAAKEIAAVNMGAVIFDEKRWRVLPHEIQRRLMNRAICWVNGRPHGPRRDAMAKILFGIHKGEAGTAEGCHVRRIAGKIWVFRELNALRGKTCNPSDVWDGRWILSPPPDQANVTGLVVRALGVDGIEHCPDWRETGRPYHVVLSSPSVWFDDELISAPVAGHAQNWHAGLVESAEAFFAALLTH